MNPRCDECKYFVEDYKIRGDFCDGSCHRYPPKGKGWPRIMQWDWCSEFKEKREKRNGF